MPAETATLTPASTGPARRQPSKFMADLTKAMLAAAEAQRSETLAQLQADAKTYTEDTNNATPAHSPILGWVRDGIPVYGPYGYSVTNNAATPTRKRSSSMNRVRRGALSRSLSVRWATRRFRWDARAADARATPAAALEFCAVSDGDAMTPFAWPPAVMNQCRGCARVFRWIVAGSRAKG